MTNEELCALLLEYKDLSVTIVSDAVSELCHIKIASVELSATTDKVWVTGTNGMACVVSAQGLQIDPDPVIGSFDNLTREKKYEQVREARIHYGITYLQRLHQCSCYDCAIRQEIEESTHRESYPITPLVDDKPSTTLGNASPKDEDGGPLAGW
jgi:hypothetical protein